MTTKNFPLRVVLAITTGRLVCSMDDVYEILNHITGDNLFTHQLPRAAETCGPVLLAQHPALRTVSSPEDLTSEEKCKRWVDTLAVRLGDELPVEQLEAWQHRNPIEELVEMMTDKPVVTVVIGDD